MRIVDRGVGDAIGTGIRTGVKHGPVRAQYRRPQFERAIGLSAAGSVRIPKLHLRASSRAPRTGKGIVELRILAVGQVRKGCDGDIGIDRQHLAIGQQRPTLFIIGIKLALSGRGPGQSLRIQQGLLLGAAVGLHVGAIRQHDALGIAYRLSENTLNDFNDTEGRRRRYRCPAIGDRVVDGTLSCPGGNKLRLVGAQQVLAALNDQAAIRQHRR
jgi:hypothetical protein